MNKQRSLCLKLFKPMACLLFMAMLSTTIRGQSIHRAKALYQAQQYHRAAALYQQILAQDSTQYHAAYYLGHCHRKMFNYPEAQRWFASVAKHAPQHFPLSIYYLAQSLKTEQRYEEAIAQYDRFLQMNSSVEQRFRQRAREEQQGCWQAVLASATEASPLSLLRMDSSVNTQFQEFAPALLNDSVLVFSSSRPDGDKMISNRSGESFFNQFMVSASEGPWKNIGSQQAFDQLNTRWHDASGSFTADARFYYFTRCDPDGNCQIFVSEFSKGRWQPGRALPRTINLPESNSKHPYISAGNDSLFFASDRPGGSGKSDIWMSIRSASGRWLDPVNLGSVINTSQSEISPFFSSEEKLLIFASDGHPGRGGMDLYLTELSSSPQEGVVPLTVPFNSSKDDCYFVVHQQQGYLASNRAGSFDIYRFGRQAGQSLRALALGMTAAPSAAKGHTAYQQVITDYRPLLTPRTDYLTTMRSGRQEYLAGGSSRFVLSADVNSIRLERMRDEQAQTRETVLVDASSEDSLARNILLNFATTTFTKQEKVILQGQVIRAESQEPVSALRLLLLDKEGNIIKITTTNEQGKFQLVNLQASTAYQIRVEEAGSDAEYLINYQLDSYGDDVQTLRFENIYFDFNQSYLRNEAKVVLDELVAYHRDHPSTIIEINAFTDSTGNDVYNLQLSQNRGLEAFNYLLSQGIDRSALVINARGASAAVVSSNSYVSQQLNRRVEIFITGRNIEYQPQIITRLLRPQVTLYQLANATGMSVEKIKQLNGLSDNQLQAYKPVRVYDWAAEKAAGLFYQMQVRSEE